MGRLRLSAFIGAVMVLSPTAGALAADYSYVEVPSGHAWYLKGYFGIAWQHFDGLEHPDFSVPAYFAFTDPGHFDPAPLFGLGIGINTGTHLRFDLTGEYRTKSAFSADDEYDTLGNADPPLFDGSPGGDWGTNHYTGKKSELLFLANGYIDIGTWHRVTPYIGAGIGASYNTISDFLDDNVPADGHGWAPTGHKWNLAWALHAGAGIQVSDRMTLDIGYSFVNLGDAKTGNFQNVDPNIACLTPGCPPMVFKNIYSHDLKVGIRWALN